METLKHCQNHRFCKHVKIFDFYGYGALKNLKNFWGIENFIKFSKATNFEGFSSEKEKGDKKMTNKIIPIAIVLAIVVIVAAFALTQTNQNTVASNVNNGSDSVTQATIIVQNGTFSPNNLTIKVGTTVTWIVKDDSNTKYMVTSNKTGSVEGKYLFMSDDLTNGQSFSYTFNKTGTYGYYDMNHMDNKKLTGTVIVQ